MLIRKNFFLFFLLVSASLNSYALPIDWHGGLGYDTTRIDTFRRTTNDYPNSAGSEEIDPVTGEKRYASFQSYVLRLSPTIIVNDGVSIFAEMTTGHGRGGFLGDSSINRANTAPNTQNTSFGNALYFFNTSDSDSNLNLTKFYMELYADTATFVIGRQPINWGLGAVYNDGDQLWDRFFSMYDGIVGKFKLGNFHIHPMWAKLNSNGQMTNATEVKDTSLAILYDNPDKDMAMGILYGKRSSGTYNTSLGSATTNASIGGTKVTIADIHFRKSFGRYSFGAELPFFSGEIGNVYDPTTKSSYRAQAILLENNFKLNEKWSFGLYAGDVSGDNGETSTFEAMYLNPNYQIANLLYRYNLHAVATPSTQSIFDSYITNSQYVKFLTKYNTDTWQWTFAYIYAQAKEVAKAGKQGFDHEKNVRFTSNGDQSTELGHELDANFDYIWNPNVTIGGGLGYLFTGDYYKFSNGSGNIETKNSYVFFTRVGVSF